MNWVYFLIFFTAGILMVRFSGWITDTTGRIEWAEKYLFTGGTYNLWKLIGVLCIVGSFWALLNF